MRDRERGVVWEESIILVINTQHYYRNSVPKLLSQVPSPVRFVFLSATIPNASGVIVAIESTPQTSYIFVQSSARGLR